MKQVKKGGQSNICFNLSSLECTVHSANSTRPVVKGILSNSFSELHLSKLQNKIKKKNIKESNLV